jgi:hypothetical protein
MGRTMIMEASRFETCGFRLETGGFSKLIMEK